MSPEGFIIITEPGNARTGNSGRSPDYPAMSKEKAETVAKVLLENDGFKTAKIQSLGDVPFVE